MYAVRCPGCQYWAEVSVGTGMRATLAPFTCTHCRELVSVPISVHDLGTLEPREETPACPECGATDIVPWPPGRAPDRTPSEDEDDPPLGPCPGCGAQLEDDGVRGIWD